MLDLYGMSEARLAMPDGGESASFSIGGQGACPKALSKSKYGGAMMASGSW